MRTIDATLLTAQKRDIVHQIAKATIGRNGYEIGNGLLGYEHIDEPMVPHRTWVDFEEGGNYYIPHGVPVDVDVGDTITISRGAIVDGNKYWEDLPDRWVESIQYFGATKRAWCIDVWGKLRLYTYETETNWTGRTLSYIANAICEAAGVDLVSTPQCTATGLNFTIPRGQNALQALRRLLNLTTCRAFHADIDEIDLRELDPNDNSVYTFSYDSIHPWAKASEIDRALRVNKVVVYGSQLSDGTRYTGSATDNSAIALTGTRAVVVYDTLQTSNALCAAKADHLLDDYKAAANQYDIAVLPAHGLQAYDVVQMYGPIWDPSGSQTVRVGKIREHWKADRITQEIRTWAPSQGETLQDIGQMPDAYIASDSVSRAKVDYAALDSTEVLGAGCCLGSYTGTITGTVLDALFYSASGRAAQVGDQANLQSQPSGSYLFFKRVADGPPPVWGRPSSIVTV